MAPRGWRFSGTDRDAVRAMAEPMLGMARTPGRLEAGEIDDLTLRRAAAGDRDASRALVEMYQVRVFALASRMLAGRGRATVEDVAQDAFLQVFLRLAAWKPGGPARLSPPADPSKTSPLERLTRAWTQLGDQSEAALARRPGAERAHAVRAEGWGSRFEHSGCPAPASGP